MTFDEMIQKVTSIDKVWVKFKRIGTDMVVIFWKDQSPIASVYTQKDEYYTDYPKLLEIDLEDILLLNDSLYEFCQTDVTERKLPF